MGTGSYTPSNRVTNQDFTRIVDTSDEWITSRTGIQSRRFVQDEPTWLLGYQAAVRAMEAAAVTAGEIDLLLVTTVSSDFFAPSLACVLQGKLGMAGGICMDINCGCAGFVYALDMARRYIACGDVKTALIVSCEALSKITDFTDRPPASYLETGRAPALSGRGRASTPATLAPTEQAPSSSMPGPSTAGTPSSPGPGKRRRTTFRTTANRPSAWTAGRSTNSL